MPSPTPTEKLPGLTPASVDADDPLAWDVALTALLCIAGVAVAAALGIWLLAPHL